MHSIPVGSLLLILVVDLVIVESLSVFMGLLIASAAGKPFLVGALLGAVAPLIGPLIWVGVLASKDRSLASVTRIRDRGARVYLGVGLLALSALLFLVATPLTWGSARGSIRQYAWVGESSAADTGVGLVAMLGSAAVMLLGLAAVMFFTVRRRVAVVVAVVGAVWLLITVDGLISFSAVNQLSRTIDGLSGGEAAAGIAPRGGLYVSLVAAVCALIGAAVIGGVRSGAEAVRGPRLHHAALAPSRAGYGHTFVDDSVASPAPPSLEEF